jgi:hypothetical protein
MNRAPGAPIARRSMPPTITGCAFSYFAVDGHCLDDRVVCPKVEIVLGKMNQSRDGLDLICPARFRRLGY